MTNKIQKALSKVQSFLDGTRQKQRKKRKVITEKLKLLRKRMKAIERKLDSKIDDEKKAQLNAELALIKSKRRKAIDILKEMQKK